MKTYTIGRDANCHIQFGDLQISRRHALIKVYPTGRMELVDMSSNGTYVNGTRVAPNKSIPVTRKDSVVFAYVGQLDWNAIPNPLKWLHYLGIAIATLLAICLLWIFVPKIIDYATGFDPDIEMGTSGAASGDGSGSSSSPTPSTPDQTPGIQENDSKEVQKKGKSWDKKIIEEDRKRKNEEGKKSSKKTQDQKREQKQEQKQETESNQEEGENNIIL